MQLKSSDINISVQTFITLLNSYYIIGLLQFKKGKFIRLFGIITLLHVNTISAIFKSMDLCRLH